MFLSFGSEAFLSSLEWSLISVAYFPNYQKMICDEINQVIGPKRFPDFKDEIRMPFTVAFLNEVLRWKTVLPFNFLRRLIKKLNKCLFVFLTIDIFSLELLKMLLF